MQEMRFNQYSQVVANTVVQALFTLWFTDQRLPDVAVLKGGAGTIFCFSAIYKEQISMKLDCLFCKIASGQIQSHSIYEDDHAFAFLDISPRAQGHTMVISKYHAPTLLELPDTEIAPLFIAVKKVAGMLQKTLEPDGFTMGINHGSVSGQTVDHLHFHIIPRWHNDGGKSLHSVVNSPVQEDLGKLAQKIKDIGA